MHLKQSHPGCYRPVAASFCLGLPILSGPAQSQHSHVDTTFDDVQPEFSEAFAIIGAYTARERDHALTALGQTLQRLDEQREETEEAGRHDWSEMSDATLEQPAAASVENLQKAPAMTGAPAGSV